MDRDDEIELEHEDDLIAALERALAGSTSEPASLCRYEELAKRENRLRAVEDRSIKPPKQLPRDDRKSTGTRIGA